MAIPVSRFVHASGREADTSAMGTERSGDWISRKVAVTGIILVAWQQINCGRHRAGHRVDVISTGKPCKSGTARSSSRRCFAPTGWR
jgi:hypothetical protein